MSRLVSTSRFHRVRPTTWHALIAGALFSLAWAGAPGSTPINAQGAAAKSTLDGVYTDAQSERGAVVAVASCEACHGQKFAGADMGPGIQAADFKMNWAGRPLSELFEKINTTMPANDPGSLGPAKAADVMAFILKLNDYPAGMTELPSEMAALQKIQIAEKK